MAARTEAAAATHIAVESLQDIRNLYRGLRFIHESVGTDPEKAARTAYFQIRHAFSFDCPMAWRYEPSRPPSQQAIEFNRAWCAARKSARKMPKPTPVCRCGSTDTVTGPGTGGHHASVRCAICSRFLAWLPKGTPTEADSDSADALGYAVHA